MREKERERENIYHHSASPPFHKFHTMQEGHSLFTSLVKSCGGPRGARGTEREKACGFYKESICIAQRKHWLEKKKKKYNWWKLLLNTKGPDSNKQKKLHFGFWNVENNNQDYLYFRLIFYKWPHRINAFISSIIRAPFTGCWLSHLL